jgi:hypothetical protein
VTVPHYITVTLTRAQADMLRRRIALEVRHPEMSEEDHALLVQALGSIYVELDRVN